MSLSFQWFSQNLPGLRRFVGLCVLVTLYTEHLGGPDGYSEHVGMHHDKDEETWRSSESAPQPHLRQLQPQPANSGELTFHINIGTEIGRKFTTNDLSAQEISHRKYEFGAIIAAVVGLLMLGAAFVHLKKTKSISIGPLRYRIGEGCFYQRTLLCCGTEGVAYGQLTIVEEAERVRDSAIEQAAPSDVDVAHLDQKLRHSVSFQKWQNEQFKHSASRKFLLLVLFGMFVTASMWIPYSTRTTVSCEQGFFWETHMTFFGVFVMTKVAELFLFAVDDTIIGEFSFLDFMVKFIASFLGYSDAYLDATAIMIAHACHQPLAQKLAFWMACDYIFGVIVLQWVVVAFFAIQEPSHACLMKIVHMDALASCVSLPNDPKWKNVWTAINLARTFGEDIWQAVFQSLYIIYVKQNYFMMISVIMGLFSSGKAVYDAWSRTLVTLSAYRNFLSADRDSVVVSGAGATHVNGIYVRQGDVDGKPRWQQQGGYQMRLEFWNRSQTYGGPMWYIVPKDNENIQYHYDGNSALPPADSRQWKYLNAPPPTPTLKFQGRYGDAGGEPEGDDGGAAGDIQGVDGAADGDALRE